MSKVCYIENCGKKVLAKGLCSRHYYRLKRGGNPETKSMKEKSLIERFWEKVIKTDGCWEWTGHKDGKGYGTFRNGKMEKAHRMAYILHFGPIPEGKLICHKCDNPSCVNPGHLFVGTDSENMQDMTKKGRGRQRNHVKLSESEVKSILSQRGIKTHKDLGLEYGVSKSAITAIMTKRNWKDA